MSDLAKQNRNTKPETRNPKHETKLKAKLRFDVSGELEQIYVENGQRVKKTYARL
jgi:multidrug efflux pump subunit AcrA (membrane-fusion protein)